MPFVFIIMIYDYDADVQRCTKWTEVHKFAPSLTVWGDVGRTPGSVICEM